jgi:hypothetical protein
MTNRNSEPARPSNPSAPSRGKQGASGDPRIVVIYDHQRYECVGRRNHTTKDGCSTTLLVFESDCPNCGNQFKQTIGEKALESRFSPNRRCSNCKSVRNGRSIVRSTER